MILSNEPINILHSVYNLIMLHLTKFVFWNIVMNRNEYRVILDGICISQMGKLPLDGGNISIIVMMETLYNEWTWICKMKNKIPSSFKWV